jgi:hypothetical protein
MNSHKHNCAPLQAENSTVTFLVRAALPLLVDPQACIHKRKAAEPSGSATSYNAGNNAAQYI